MSNKISYSISFALSSLLLTSAAFAQSIAQTTPSLPASYGAAQLGDWDTHSWGVDTWIPAQTVTLAGQDNSSTATVSLVGSAKYSLGGPYVLATASNPSDNMIADPGAFLTYYFEVYGPQNTTVSLTATGVIGNGINTESSNGIPSFAESYLGIFNLGGNQIATVASCVNLSSCTGYQNAPASINEIYSYNTQNGYFRDNYSITFDVSTNTVYSVVLGADVGINFNYVQNASGWTSGWNLGLGISYIDPVLTISPSFLASNPGYQIAFSQGISQASGVPEASTWAMMLAGFAGLGFVGYRRNKGAALAA